MSNPNAILRQALAQHQVGALPAACDLYRQVLAVRPGDPDALHLLGVACGAKGDPEQGVELILRAIAARPLFPAAHFNLGTMLLGQGQAGPALVSLQICLQQAPNHTPAVAASGHAMLSLGRARDAIAGFTAVLETRPNDVDTLIGRAAALRMLDRLDEAICDLDQALLIRPDHVPALINRADTALDQLHYDLALSLYDRALAEHPDDLAILMNRGVTLRAMGLLEQALGCWRQVLDRRPGDPDATLNIGLCLLQMGDWHQGWQAHEARLRRPPWIEALKTATAPQWDGRADLAGRRLLLVGEQGLGDTIQFCRFAHLAATRGATVILGVDPPLRRLMTTLTGVTEVICPGDPDPDYDLFCPLMSLPARLALTLDDAAMHAPYLCAHPDIMGKWRARLASATGRKVGLVWSGDPRADDPAARRLDRRRSVTLDCLAPLLAIPGITFVSLQKGLASAHAAAWPIVDWTAELRDFAETAALIQALDLVITVDTSVAHAAGALGQPVWVLNRFDCCWRWMAGRTNTIWYPSMRLFTQTRPGVWDDVIADVAAALADA